MSEHKTICHRCANEYNWYSQEPPEGATIYWNPRCPSCGADITANPVTETWLNIVGSSLNSKNEHSEELVEKLNAQSRLYHGRLANADVAELIDIAQHFDSQTKEGRKWGPDFYRDVAYAVRKQAREKAMR